MVERFAENLSWYYHTIPFITAIFGLIIGDALIQDYGPLAKTIFPSICLIVGGYGGLIILGEISERKK
ncbi:MAG: hypothetical protein CMB47_01880 [Euryarchaeota archaeon]|nr:hypothetical protein [Euryarchaeota archaeon]|tara:strand:+ start:666 stop:869 length:204 start_codon:yes stop_codon:yes gene_type:complete